MSNALEPWRAIPVLPAADFEATLAFYVEKLGFREKFQFDDYTAVSRAGIEIHFWKCDEPQIAENSGCRIEVRGIDELYAAYRAAGIVYPDDVLETMPWGFRQFVVVDPDRNAITFAEDVET